MKRNATTLRIPESMSGALREEAENKGISMHELILLILSYYLEHKPIDIV